MKITTRKPTHRAGSAKATTIKIEGALLKAIESAKLATESVSAYVRKAVEFSIRKSKMRKAGEAYAEFLSQHPKESSWIREWSDSNLADKMK